jgi:hypothetical protein
VFYGDVCMDWTYIGRVVALLGDQEVLSLFQQPVPEAAKSARPFVTGILGADTMLGLRKDIIYMHPNTLYWLLRRTTYFDSTDKRDKIYALLGLATDESTTVIIPDYTITPQSLYTATTRHILLQQDGKTLTVLRYAGIGVSRSLEGLPSWVPD